MSRRKSNGTTAKSRRFKILNVSLFIIYVLLISVLIVYIFKYNILAFRYLNIISTFVMILIAVLAALFIWFNKDFHNGIVGSVLADWVSNHVRCQGNGGPVYWFEFHL